MFSFVPEGRVIIARRFNGGCPLLLAYRVLPRQPKDPEKLELWHRKFGPMMKVLGPALIVFGLLRLLGALH